MYGTTASRHLRLDDFKSFSSGIAFLKRRISSVPEPEAFVFISYSHVDARFADEFCARLKKAGVQYFIDRSSIEWGGHIPDHVHAALEKASHLVVLISPGSERSQWVAYEMGYARGKKVRIVPYLLHPSMQVPGFISSIRYLHDAKDEADFIKSLKHKKSEVARASISPTIATAARPTTQQQAENIEPVEKRLTASSGDTRRLAVLEMGEKGDRRFVPLIEEMLGKEQNQNVRESGIKALGAIGGERAATILEQIWHVKEPSRFGRDAAKNAMMQLHLWNDPSPLLNPDAASGLFVRLETSESFRDSKRDRTKQELIDEISGARRAKLFSVGTEGTVTSNSLQLDGFSLRWNVTRLQQQWYYRIHYVAEVTSFSTLRLLEWNPSSADDISLWLSEPFNVDRAALRARALGFAVELLLENRIRVSASDWPCFRPGLTHGSFAIDCSVAGPDIGCKVQCSSMPWGIDTDWDGSVRFLIRCIRFLQLS